MDKSSSVPINKLRATTVACLASNLDSTKLLLSRKTRRLRDWRGLRPDLSASQVHSAASSLSPTTSLLRLWTSATVEDLIQALKAMERFDVLEDAEKLIERDCLDYIDHISLRNPNENMVDGPEVDLHGILTNQDAEHLRAGLGLCNFDALVLHGDDDEEDVAFAEHLVDRMETAGLKVFLPKRDLQPGTVLHSASASIIQDRCKKVVTVLSPSFLRSKENTFLTDFAQYVGLTKSSHMIIPVLFKQCDLPGQISQLMKLVYDPRPSHSAVNFYRRLLEKPFNLPTLPTELTIHPPQFKPAINTNRNNSTQQSAKEGIVYKTTHRTSSKPSPVLHSKRSDSNGEAVATAIERKLQALPGPPDDKLQSTDSLVSSSSGKSGMKTNKKGNGNVSKVLKGLFKGDKKKREPVQ